MPKANKNLWTNVAIAAIASAFWISVGSMVVDHAQHHDFLSFYTGGVIARDHAFQHVYDIEFQKQLQKSILPDAPAWAPVIRPPLFTVMAAPFAFLPYFPAYWVYLGVQIAMLLAAWVWATVKFGSDALVYCAFFLPAAVGLTHAEDNVWMLAIVIGTYVLAEKDLDLSAGALLAVGLVKFHLLLLFPVVMLVQRRFRMLLGFALAAAVEACISFALIGVDGIRQYLSLLGRSDLQALTEGRWAMLDVQAVPLNFGLESQWWAAPLVAMVVMMAIAGSWQAPLWRWFSVAATASLLISPHAYKYDATLLLLPILLAIFRSASKFTRIAAATAVIPIPYLLTVLGPPISVIPALTVLTFLAALTHEGWRERAGSAEAPAALAVGS